ncbi:DNA primase large subunit-like [Clavelina lepadiformis]|uniref:DNA primase large subunit-like n=1 Tax=Clavelina lepadiformis TaxID=159417 RepID=UPI0040433DEB
MQFGGTPKQAVRRRNRRLQLNANLDDCSYPHNLMMYNDPPTMNITLQEFEAFAFERVKVLHYLDSLSVSAVKNSQTYNAKLTEFLRKNYPGFLLQNGGDRDVSEAELEWRRRDHISHFILRLAYCKSEELRRWFLEKELDLFKFRFLQESMNSVQSFLRQNNLTYTPISDDEKERFRPFLTKISLEVTEAALEKTFFYRVPFVEVLNLVSSRRVFLYQGDAFVPQKEFLSIISNQFREHLSKALTLTARSLPELEEDDRLLPILCSFNKNALSTAYDPKRNEGKVSVNDLDDMSQTSYPLCMRQLHRALKDTHHLRHWGRMQYGLFLKGIGVTLEESLKFWRQELGKGIGEDKFDKEHAYNIRHNYGKEGKRTNYTPYSCMTIITKNPPAAQDHHGCPFKHTSPDLLRQKLRSYKTSNDVIDEITDLVKGQHFQIACQKYFEYTHKLEDSSFQVTHPNHYFDESQKILKDEKVPRQQNNQDKNVTKFAPNWSMPNSQKEDKSNLTEEKKFNNEWEDSTLEQMMMEYSEE